MALFRLTPPTIDAAVSSGNRTNPMYVPAHFAEDRIPVLHEAIDSSGLATLVTLTADGLIASHVPLMLNPDPAPYGTLIGHLARPNPQAREAIGEALAIFQGPEGYITPSYYATKRETGKVVPTWNYIAIHAYGTLRFIDDRTHLLDIVTRLTNRHEGPRAAPWTVSDAPADFVQGMLNGIIGFELTITRLEGKRKMSQNRPEADRTGVVLGLVDDGRPDLAREVAQASAEPAATGPLATRPGQPA
jgi:transcriptional regulator